jgi:hypothetical protein
MRPSQVLVLSRKISPNDYLSSDVLSLLNSIQVENPRKSLPRKTQNSRNRRHDNTSKKTSFKKKAESFDDAMRMKIVADLNKLTDKNYDVIVKQIQALYSRISEDLKGNVLKLIIENSTKQHMFACEYMRMYMDLIKDTKKEQILGTKILQEELTNHISTIFTEITNGENYDDFCNANKLKETRIGLSIMLGEACNLGMIRPQTIGQHALNLLKSMDKIRENASSTNRETVENQTECVIQFFKTIAKTKILRDGFQSCISDFEKLLHLEKTEKKLNPKARFALMDFLDDMKKLHTKAKQAEDRKKANVYVPRSFRGKKTDI